MQRVRIFQLPFAYLYGNLRNPRTHFFAEQFLSTAITARLFLSGSPKVRAARVVVGASFCNAKNESVFSRQKS